MPDMSRVIWLLAGSAWAGRSLVGFADPEYWSPVTVLDWTAVWLFSAALLLFAPSLILLGRLAKSRSVMTFAKISAIGALVAGGANAIEDGFGVAIFGTLYVVGILTMGLALLPLALTLYRARCLRLAGLSVLLFVGLIPLFNNGGGLVILGGLGALAITPSWFTQPGPASIAADKAPAG